MDTTDPGGQRKSRRGDYDIAPEFFYYDNINVGYIFFVYVSQQHERLFQ